MTKGKPKVLSIQCGRCHTVSQVTMPTDEELKELQGKQYDFVIIDEVYQMEQEEPSDTTDN